MSCGWWVLAAGGGVLALSLAFPTPRRLWVLWLVVLRIGLVALGQGIGFRRLAARLAGRPYVVLTRPRLARRLCEDLGPTFIKFGQIVASSAGIFPQAYVDEFKRVLDRVRPFGFGDVQRILAEELGGRADDLIELEPRPLASASIAQVHTARLRSTGVAVVIKVQRPGIEARTRADVKLLRLLAILLERFVRDAELANPRGIVDDFAATMREELDFTLEAANQLEFNRIMGVLARPDVRAPVPVSGYVTRRVLVMERFSGTRIDDVAAVRARTDDPEGKLILGMRAWFQCALRFGFFHGDVHAGNLMLLDDGHLGFLDFGIVGRFDDRQRKLVLDYVMAFVTGDFGLLADTLASMGALAAGPPIDRVAFVADLERAYGPLRSTALGQLNYAEIFPEIQRVVSRHRVKQVREFVLITKQLLYFDRYAKLLAPAMSLFTDPRLVAGLAQDMMTSGITPTIRVNPTS